MKYSLLVHLLLLNFFVNQAEQILICHGNLVHDTVSSAAESKRDIARSPSAAIVGKPETRKEQRELV